MTPGYDKWEALLRLLPREILLRICKFFGCLPLTYTADYEDEYGVLLKCGQACDSSGCQPLQMYLGKGGTSGLHELFPIGYDIHFREVLFTAAGCMFYREKEDWVVEFQQEIKVQEYDTCMQHRLPVQLSNMYVTFRNDMAIATSNTSIKNTLRSATRRKPGKTRRRRSPPKIFIECAAWQHTSRKDKLWVLFNYDNVYIQHPSVPTAELRAHAHALGVTHRIEFCLQYGSL